MQSVKQLFTAFVLTLICWSLVPSSALAISNGDFSAGLSDWDAFGDVSVSSGEAVLADDLDFFGTLFQNAVVAPGNYEFSFDFQNNVSDEVPDFTFPDAVFVSAILSDDPVGDPLAPPVGSTTVALFDAFGASVEDVYEGSIGASSKGPGWERYSVVVAITTNYFVPVFDLLDSNFIFADSTFLIDNVALTSAPIPEPATALLLLLGGAGAAVRKRFTAS